MRRRTKIGALLVATASLPFLLIELAAHQPIDANEYFITDRSPSIQDADGRTLYSFLNEADHWCFPVILEAVSPHLIQATIAVEDQRFYEHDGVDRRAVTRAVWQNATAASIRSGASTITMQLVKLTDDLPRSVPGKAMQAARALRLERNTSKEKIFETYLNRASYGFNLLGCEAASHRYFGKSAAELTLSEAALLAALPKSPSALNPLNHQNRARARRDYVLSRMHAEGLITEDELESAAGEPVKARWHAFENRAPHLAMHLREEASIQSSIQTTVRAELQTEIETLVSDHVDELGSTITNGAAIVIDAETANVLARVGSAAFFDTPGGGQVDALRALRSPGSALKPFTYALAIERNALYPSEKLLDNTLDYGLYRPQNYDGKTRGLISASYALRRSLNVPAVMVQERIGTIALADFLHNAGIRTLRKRPAHYGIGLTLGNCEVRLEELAAAYCAIANLGEYRPLRTIATDTLGPRSTVMNPGTAAAIFAMLEQPLPGGYQKDTILAEQSPPRVALKTGTSTGQRDAWSMVFNRHYVVGVWIGNNDGSRSEGLVGAQAALPLAAKIFRTLPRKSSSAWPNSHGAMTKIKVCAASGLPISEWCPYHTEAAISAQQLVLRKCAVHLPTEERWPETSRGWDLAQLAAESSPIDDAAERSSLSPLSITEPANNAEFVMTGEKTADRIRLTSTHDEEGGVYWYLNGAFAGRANTHSPVYLNLKPGNHHISCMTETGEQDSIHFSVSTPYRPRHFEID